TVRIRRRSRMEIAPLAMLDSGPGRISVDLESRHGCLSARKPGRSICPAHVRRDIAIPMCPPCGAGTSKGNNHVLELPAIKVASRRLLGAMALSLVFALAPAAAQDSLTNTATVAGPSWVTDPDPANNTDSAVVDVTATVAYDFCPVGGEVLGIAAGGVVWRLDAGGTSTPLINISDGGFTGAPADALMIDPVRNRLLYVTSGRIRAYDGATVGWYTAAGLDPSVDATSAAMTQDGIGYLVGGGASPQVWEVTLAANGTSYDVTALGALTYDHAPPAGNPSDLAIDANGTGWLAVGGMLYT